MAEESEFDPHEVGTIVRNKEQIERLRQEQRALVVAYYHFFKSADGQKILHDLEEQFHNRSSIVPGDPYATHAREGARELVLYIHEMIKAGETNV